MQNGSDAANAQDKQRLENIRALIIATRRIEDTNAAIKLYDLIAGVYLDFPSTGLAETIRPSGSVILRIFRTLDTELRVHDVLVRPAAIGRVVPIRPKKSPGKMNALVS